ncbi:methyltransferase, partial [Clostridioides difficile]|uniref:methyltransferase n=1 Tax=Clostridioides difficile TaxID=1496 RepID=UPI0018DD4E5D
DIVTGSGAIKISLANYIENSKIMSFDISETALEIAKKNAIINEVGEKITHITSDLFTAISDRNIKFDIIVTNPPYIKKQDIET